MQARFSSMVREIVLWFILIRNLIIVTSYSSIPFSLWATICNLTLLHALRGAVMTSYSHWLGSAGSVFLSQTGMFYCNTLVVMPCLLLIIHKGKVGYAEQLSLFSRVWAYQWQTLEFSIKCFMIQITLSHESCDCQLSYQHWDLLKLRVTVFNVKHTL
jgi:hypothetical protein